MSKTDGSDGYFTKVDKPAEVIVADDLISTPSSSYIIDDDNKSNRLVGQADKEIDANDSNSLLEEFSMADTPVEELSKKSGTNFVDVDTEYGSDIIDYATEEPSREFGINRETAFYNNILRDYPIRPTTINHIFSTVNGFCRSFTNSIGNSLGINSESTGNIDTNVQPQNGGTISAPSLLSTNLLRTFSLSSSNAESPTSNLVDKNVTPQITIDSQNVPYTQTPSPVPSSTPSTNILLSTSISSNKVYFAGTIYDNINSFKSKFVGLPWMTYRTGRWNDSGWGCMHRGGQMLLASTLFRHYKIEPNGKKLSLSNEFISDENQKAKYVAIMKLFLDSPWSRFSLQNIATVGLMFDVPVGAWFGPTTIAHVLQYLSVTDFLRKCKLLAISNEKRKNLLNHNLSSDTLEEKLSDSSIDDTEHNVHRLSSNKRVRETNGNDEQPGVFIKRVPINELNDKSNPDWIGIQIVLAKDSMLYLEELPTNKPTLILIPLMLGAENVNEIYHTSLFNALEIKHSVGILGGKPNSALFFVGHTSDKKLVYLDPHIPHNRLAKLNSEISEDNFLTDLNQSEESPSNIAYSSPIEFNVEDFVSYHCDNISTMDINRIDPSIMLAFYYRNETELNDLLKEFERKELIGSKLPLFSVQSSKKDVRTQMIESEKLLRRTSTLLDDGDDF